jgi:hypothetical protein
MGVKFSLRFFSWIAIFKKYLTINFNNYTLALCTELAKVECAQH